MKILVILGGSIQHPPFYSRLIRNVDLIIAADGGYFNADKLDLEPDYLIGDLDSLNEDILEEICIATRTKVIHDPDQDILDSSLAIKLALTKNPSDIIIIGAGGKEIDHALANYLDLLNFQADIPIKIIDEYSEIQLLRAGEHTITGEINEKISFIPLTLIKDLEYKGLKFPAPHNIPIDIGTLLTRNTFEKPEAKISFSSGVLLMIRPSNSL